MAQLGSALRSGRRGREFKYILKEKIDQAKLLLSGTTENIQTISDNLSFSNRSYFYTCFQKYVGMSPSEYRAQNDRI